MVSDNSHFTLKRWWKINWSWNLIKEFEMKFFWVQVIHLFIFCSLDERETLDWFFYINKFYYVACCGITAEMLRRTNVCHRRWAVMRLLVSVSDRTIYWSDELLCSSDKEICFRLSLLSNDCSVHNQRFYIYELSCA